MTLQEIVTTATLLILGIGAQTATAQEFCSLNNPHIVTTANTASMKVSIACSVTSSPTTVRYPNGPLYIGVTLYKVDDQRLRTLVVPIVEDQVEHVYVKPVEFTRPANSQEIEIPLVAVGTNTHILMAVWDKKQNCAASNQADGCGTAGATFGETDAFLLPIPVDTWPRPVCNIAGLERSGFFNWVETEGDFGGPQVPDRYRSMLNANDCFMRFPNRAGLGYSVRRWRAQPLATR